MFDLIYIQISSCEIKLCCSTLCLAQARVFYLIMRRVPLCILDFSKQLLLDILSRKTQNSRLRPIDHLCKLFRLLTVESANKFDISAIKFIIRRHEISWVRLKFRNWKFVLRRFSFD